MIWSLIRKGCKKNGLTRNRSQFFDKIAALFFTQIGRTFAYDDCSGLFVATLKIAQIAGGQIKITSKKIGVIGKQNRATRLNGTVLKGIIQQNDLGFWMVVQ